MSFQTDFRNKLRKTFSKEEVRSLCFDLELDYDDLKGETKTGKIESLIVAIVQNNLADAFIIILRRERPKEEWPNSEELKDLDWTIFDHRRGITAKTMWAILGAALLLGGFSGLIWWYSQQPVRMDGDFNIAVAEFVQTGDTDPIAPIISQRIFSYLDGAYKQSSFETVQVIHDNIGTINGADEAQALADKVNAQLVIYGSISSFGDGARISPKFYVVSSHRNAVSEINGEHALEDSISLLKSDITSDAPESIEKMERRSSILIEFTKALVYRAGGTDGDIKLARNSIDLAIEKSEELEAIEHSEDFKIEGKEVLFLYASDIARRQEDFEQSQNYIDEALSLNSEYGRAYIGLGNIQYDLGNLFQAKSFYMQAATFDKQPFGAYVIEKAHIGIGNCCNLQYQFVNDNDSADANEAIALANCALTSYSIVTNSYEQQDDPEFILKQLASSAYYYSGVIYQDSGRNDLARPFYEIALQLSEDPKLIAGANTRLKEVESK